MSEDNLEMSARLHAIPAKIPYSESDSPSRRDMNASQLSQALCIEGATLPHILTGSEREFAKYTHMVMLADERNEPCRAAIRKIIDRYPQNRRSKDGFQSGTLVIYENADDPGLFGCELVPYQFNIHSQFGFRYVRTETMDHLRTGQTLPKGAILAHSPCIESRSTTTVGNEKPGIGLNAVFVTKFEGIEDGCGIADDVVDKIATRCYQTVTIGCGKNSVPLNKFGDKLKYKIMADIGEYIGTDGIAIATRKVDELLNLVTMTPAALREVDDDFDTPIFIHPGARVVDIEVIRTFPKNSAMLTGMEDQLEYYYDRTLQYHHSILEAYAKIKKDVPEPRLTPEFNRLIRKTIALTENSHPNCKLTLTSRGKTPLDEWTIKLTLEYLLVGADGSKLTDGHGGKVVVVRILPRADMPVDEHGVSADIILLDEASANRMNTGRDVEQAVNAARTRLLVDINNRFASDSEQSAYAWAWDRLTELYRTIDPGSVKYYERLNPRRHIDHIRRHGIYLQRKLTTGTPPAETVRLLRDRFDIAGTPITYRNYDGRMVTTKKPALIAELYMYVLEKVADTAAAVSSAKMQHYNVPANPSNMDKLSSPSRDNATKILGETETRIVTTHTPTDTLMELFDQTANIVAHTEVIFSILEAPYPMLIEKAVNRDKIPLTGGRVNAVAHMMISVSGVKLVNRKGEP